MIVIPNSHAEAGERGTLRCTYLSGTSAGLLPAMGSNLAAASATPPEVRFLCRPPPEVAFGMTIMENYCFLRGTGAGGNGRRIGTIAPREGSLAALARDITSSWRYFTKSCI